MDQSTIDSLEAALRELPSAGDCAASESGVGADAPTGDSVSLLRRENEGLADEVLRSYEQLNLVFDLTNQIASVTEPDELINLLLSRLARVFAAPVVCLYGAGGRRLLFDACTSRTEPVEGLLGLDTSLHDSIERVRRERRPIVRTVGEFQILLAALPRLDERVDVVLALRASGPGAFRADDLLLADSILSFGGQIIRNSELHLQLRAVSMETTRALVAAIDKKDHYTRGHSERVGQLAKLTGRAQGLAGRDLQLLEWAGLLHDVGKIGVPEAILQKSGRLTEEEFAIIKKHPEMGYEILKPIASFKEVLDGVLHHHENPDGSGYPAGLKSDSIPLFARIIHVVDVFDALSSTRSYRPAFSIEGAIDILRKEAGSKLDSSTVEAFLGVLERQRTESPQAFAAVYAPEALA